MFTFALVCVRVFLCVFVWSDKRCLVVVGEENVEEVIAEVEEALRRRCGVHLSC